MWRFPELNVVAHGYGDAYTDSELAHVNTIETVEAGWVDLVRDTGAEYAVVDPDSPWATRSSTRSTGRSSRTTRTWSCCVPRRGGWTSSATTRDTLAR